MFERFTTEARQTVVLAQDQARRLRHAHIGTEHLLLALAQQEGTASATVLAAHGLTPQVIVDAITAYVGPDDLDAEALSTLGIDLAAVRTTVEATFGPGALHRRSPGRRESVPSGHIPFTPRARKVLELSLREALALEHRSIADGHILLGLLREGDGLAAKVVYDRGLEPDGVREDITSALTG
jgi:ATP-dependent Clp protease ATP-binding subunit ClpA